MKLSKQLLILIGVVVLVGGGVLAFFYFSGTKQTSNLKPLWEQKREEAAKAAHEETPKAPETKTAEAPKEEPQKAPETRTSVPETKTPAPEANAKFSYLSGTIQDERGFSIEGASVSIYEDKGKPEPGAKPVKTVTSDTNGTFQFDSLPAGFFYVEASKDGFSQEKSYGLSIPRTRQIQFILYQTGSIFGTVRDQVTGAPIDKALLLVSYQDASQRIEAGGEFLTDEQGMFRLSGLRANRQSILITVQKASYASFTRREASLQIGEFREVPFGLVQGVQIIGKVVDEAGAALANASVYLEDAGIQALLSRSTTNEKGEFSLSEVSPFGVYSIVASMEGYQSNKVSNLKSPFGEVTVPLARFGIVAGVVNTSDGTAVPKFTVKTFREANLGHREFEHEKTFIDSNGIFEVDKIAPGEMTVMITAEGFAPERIEKIKVTAGAKVEGLQITLKRGGSVFGNIVNEEGQPLGGARIYLSDQATTGAVIGLVGRPRESDERGRFALTGVPGGPASILIRKEGWADSVVFFQAETEQSTNLGQLKMQRGGAVEGVCLGPSGETLRGFVIEVTPALRLDARRIQADNSGRFRIDSLPEGPVTLTGYYPGTLKGVSSLHRFHRTIEAVNGKVFQVDFDYRVGGRIAGKIVGTSALPGEQLIINLLNEYGETVEGSTVVDSENHFEIPAVDGGEYELRLRSTLRDLSSSKVVSLYPNEQREVNFYIGKAKVTGSVTDIGGKPLAGALLVLRRSQSDPVGYRGTSNQNGEFNLEGLEEGTYRVEVTKTNFAPGVISQFVVGPDESKSFKLQLGAAASLKLVLQSPNGEPVGKIAVYVDKTNDPEFPGGGEYEATGQGLVYCNNLSEGNYEITPIADAIFPGAVPISLKPEIQTESHFVVRRRGNLVVLARHMDTWLRDIDINPKLKGAEFQGNAFKWMQESKIHAQPVNMTTGEDGRVTFEGLPEGNYDVQVLSGSRGFPVTVKAGETVELTVEL